MATATKAESQKIFEKLKTKPANKVSRLNEVGPEMPLMITGVL